MGRKAPQADQPLKEEAENVRNSLGCRICRRWGNGLPKPGSSFLPQALSPCILVRFSAVWTRGAAGAGQQMSILGGEAAPGVVWVAAGPGVYS